MNYENFYVLASERFAARKVKFQMGCTDYIIQNASHDIIPLKFLAYMLATTLWETSHTMNPVRETLAKTTDIAIRRLDKAFEAGKLPWVKKPYWRKDADGKSWLGRGFVQLTHKVNYERLSKATGFDLVTNPEKAMDVGPAYEVMAKGMIEGLFTGKKLGDYINGAKTDYVGARYVVNGTNNAVKIAAYAEVFEGVLEACGYVPGQSGSDTTSIPPNLPPPHGASEPEKQPDGVGFFAALLAILKALFGGK